MSLEIEILLLNDLSILIIDAISLLLFLKETIPLSIISSPKFKLNFSKIFLTIFLNKKRLKC